MFADLHIHSCLSPCGHEWMTPGNIAGMAKIKELDAIAMDIYHHAEQGYHEYRTAGIVADYLKKLGLDTQEGLAITGVRADTRLPS